MVPVPPVFSGLARGPDRARAARHGGAGENGGFTVKKHHSERTVPFDGGRHDRLRVLPVNPAFAPIEIEVEALPDLVIVTKYVPTPISS